MTNRTTVLISIAAICASLISHAPMAVQAKPNKLRPDHAMNVSGGYGCGVADATGAYHFDEKCRFQYNVQYESGKSGTPEGLKSFKYHDQGTLPPGAPRPAETRVIPYSADFFGWGLICTGSETTTPSGEYRSTCQYN